MYRCGVDDVRLEDEDAMYGGSPLTVTFGLAEKNNIILVLAGDKLSNSSYRLS